jgi:hypothetical protein
MAAALAQNAPLGLRETEALPSTLNPEAALALDLTASKSNAKTKKSAHGNRGQRGNGRQRRSLAAYPGAERAGLRGGGSTPDPQAAPVTNVAAIATPDRKHGTPADERPFDPIGISFGGLRLRPYVDQDFGYASNPLSVPFRIRGSAFENTEARMTFQSDWSRDELHGAVRGGYTDYFSNSEANAPHGSGLVAGRFDLSKSVSLDAETHFEILTQTPGSLTLPYGAVLISGSRPLVNTFGGSVGGATRFGDLTLSLHGTLDRAVYGNTAFDNGVVDELSSYDSSDWGLRDRISYQIGSTIAPFVELDGDRRVYDAGIDPNGYYRDSRGVSASGGLALTWAKRLIGEISVGYGSRSYQDPRLPDVHAPLINGSFTWMATPLTSLALKVGTNLTDTTTLGASGAVSRIYTIGVTHALFRNLFLSATASYATDVYSGIPVHDETTNLGLSAEYNVSRDLLLRSTVTRTQYNSNVPHSSYVADIFMFGLRFQR